MNKSQAKTPMACSARTALALVLPLIVSVNFFTGCTKQAPEPVKEVKVEPVKEAPVEVAVEETPESRVLGKTEAEVVALLGHPVSKAVLNGRGIYRWSDSIVSFENGRASKFEFRDLKREKANRADSLRAAEEAERRQAQAEAKQRHDKMVNDRYLANSLDDRAYAAQQEAQRQQRKQDEDNRAAADAKWRLDEQNRRAANAQANANYLNAIKK